MVKFSGSLTRKDNAAPIGGLVTVKFVARDCPTCITIENAQTDMNGQFAGQTALKDGPWAAQAFFEGDAVYNPGVSSIVTFDLVPGKVDVLLTLSVEVI